MKRLLAAVCAAGMTIAAAPLSAATYNLITMSELIGVFRSAGLSVSTTSQSEVLAVGGSFVWLTDCRPDSRCAEISIFRNYGDVNPTMSAVNEWNNTKKIPEASMNADGTLHMEMWISGVGATDTNIVDTFNWFEAYAADQSFWAPFMTGAQS